MVRDVCRIVSNQKSIDMCWSDQREEREASRCLHLGGDGGPRLLDVELCRVLHLALAIACRHRVEALILIGHVEDDEGVATALLHNPHVLAVRQRLVCRLEMFHFQFVQLTDTGTEFLIQF